MAAQTKLRVCDPTCSCGVTDEMGDISIKTYGDLIAFARAQTLLAQLFDRDNALQAFSARIGYENPKHIRRAIHHSG